MGGDIMPEAPAFDVAQLIDNERFRAFNWKLLLVTLLLMMSDGFDVSALAYSAPALMKAWAISSIATLGPVLSASIVGILFGAPIFGYLGDRLGRRTAMIASTLTFGVFSLAATQAGNLSEMLALRVLAGLGLGGLFPLSVALNNEFAPRRVRATLVTLMMVAASVGGAIPGMVAAWLIPKYGWQVMFLIGGAVPLIMACYAFLVLPESIKFLVLKDKPSEVVTEALKNFKPGITLPENPRYVVSGEQKVEKVSVTQLFTRENAIITSLLWVVFIVVGMGFYFFSVWMVTILTHVGVPVAQAAIAGSLYQLGGAIGALALCRPMDWYGLAPIIFLFGVSIPSVAALALPGLPAMAIFAIMFMIGFCLLGLKSVINTAAGMIYPTSLRSSGVGWAVGVGAVGSVTSIVMAGVLIRAGLSIEHLFLLVAILMAIGTLAWLAISRLHAAKADNAAQDRLVGVAAGQ
jgi:AAHS family 4-hydroxybenzoate transporter-like MFS transporter